MSARMSTILVPGTRLSIIIGSQSILREVYDELADNVRLVDCAVYLKSIKLCSGVSTISLYRSKD